MSTDPHAPKVFTDTIHLDAAAADVWKAVTDGAELARWFPIAARVTPPKPDGSGGSVFLSWGPMCEGEAPLTLWEPPKRAAWTESHAGGVQITVMFELAPAAGGRGTVLRVTQSGFGRGAAWDDMYDSISNGWKFELRSLRHYLSHHAGRDRDAAWVPSPSPLAIDACWRALVGGAGKPGLLRSGRLGGYAEGDAYSFTGPDGRTYSGTVLRSVENKGFAGTVKELSDGVIRIEIERRGGESTPCVWVAEWGKSQGSGGSGVIAEAWAARVRELVGSANIQGAGACQA
jgi:uncharacterized protein YndB with AHSA1/START domain